MPLTRRKEREIAFQMLFAAQFSPEEDTAKLYETLIEEQESEEAKTSEYIKTVFCGARDYAPEATKKIEENAKGWKIGRLSKATLAVLLLAIFEMDQMDSVPEKIAINEAVELAKSFCEDGAKKFVNGILGAVAGK